MSSHSHQSNGGYERGAGAFFIPGITGKSHFWDKCNNNNNKNNNNKEEDENEDAISIPIMVDVDHDHEDEDDIVDNYDSKNNNDFHYGDNVTTIKSLEETLNSYKFDSTTSEDDCRSRDSRSTASSYSYFIPGITGKARVLGDGDDADSNGDDDLLNHQDEPRYKKTTARTRRRSAAINQEQQHLLFIQRASKSANFDDYDDILGTEKKSRGRSSNLTTTNRSLSQSPSRGYSSSASGGGGYTRRRRFRRKADYARSQSPIRDPSSSRSSTLGSDTFASDFSANFEKLCLATTTAGRG